jgi:ABC-type proline/glycine betaine transport system permease subunit
MNEFWNDFEQFWATNDHWIWVALGAAAILVVAGLLIGYVTTRKRELDRKQAAATRRTSSDRTISGPNSAPIPGKG